MRYVVEEKEAWPFSLLLYSSVDALLSFLGKTETWNPVHLLPPQVQQEHLWTDLQLLSSTGISRCIRSQGTSNHRKAAFQKVCQLLFRLKKIQKKRERKKKKK